jgi:hypothetical protein
MLHRVTGNRSVLSVIQGTGSGERTNKWFSLLIFEPVIIYHRLSLFHISHDFSAWE